MTGTAVTTCALNTVITTTLFKSNIFTGAQFSNAAGIWSEKAAVAASTVTLPFWGKVGPGLYVAKITTASTFVTTAVVGLATQSGQNAYWDFM